MRPLLDDDATDPKAVHATTRSTSTRTCAAALGHGGDHDVCRLAEEALDGIASRLPRGTGAGSSSPRRLAATCWRRISRRSRRLSAALCLASLSASRWLRVDRTRAVRIRADARRATSETKCCRASHGRDRTPASHEWAVTAEDVLLSYEACAGRAEAARRLDVARAKPGRRCSPR